VTITDEQMTDAVTSVLSSLAGIAVTRVPDVRPDETFAGTDALTGIVTITGDCDAVVVLRCERGLAEDMAAAMFGLPTDELTGSDVIDAIGEVVNVSGGTIKAMLEGSYRLGLPIVTAGRGHHIDVPGARTVALAAFVHDDRPLSIEVLLADHDTAIARWVDRLTHK
jgi:CheY-specific phosphatase CheX